MRISNSEYERFLEDWYKDKFKGQRLGQAFCCHFRLSRSQEGKEIESTLWELDGTAAIVFIAKMIDWEN